MNAEGLIRFQVQQDRSPGCQEVDIIELEKWRCELRRLGLVGCDPARYDGFGFGNLSRRMRDGTFLITGSQTGVLASLSAAEYVRITESEPRLNHVCAQGLCRPSSEFLTHLAAYTANPKIYYVFHVHSPEIWNGRDRLGIPMTGPSIECGTVEMFEAVRALLAEPVNDEKGILAMAGHLDGILAWGETADETGNRLLGFLSRAAEVNPPPVNAESPAYLSSVPAM
ncbi:MAG TPA: class II aldolase/adducin family protein [Verrucomicrobiae bacterium]|nr:class II aldolase/adducin family protein [Verrucomicrobiae bacterium]